VWDAESGELHRELESFGGVDVTSIATFPSADGQHMRLVVGASGGELRVYDPEAGSVLHRLHGRGFTITSLACIASSSAAPHHSRIVSASSGGTPGVYDGETGELLAELRGGSKAAVWSVVVWKEQVGGHDRIATTGDDCTVKVWDGEAFTLLHELRSGGPGRRLLSLQSAEGPHRLVVMMGDREGLQLWDPEEGYRLHNGINRGPLTGNHHLLESAEGRFLLVLTNCDRIHPRHRDDTYSLRTFIDVLDMGEVPSRSEHLRPAHRHG
jgi:WD40 repeat protein